MQVPGAAHWDRAGLSHVCKINFYKREATAMQKIYTAPEVAKLLRVKKSYVYELVASKRLKAVKLSERRLRIPESAVEEYLAKEMN
jgi:excisionase family DNA binding protein